MNILEIIGNGFVMLWYVQSFDAVKDYEYGFLMRAVQCHWLQQSTYLFILKIGLFIA